jgi:pyrroline-5-carboxylate reductase
MKFVSFGAGKMGTALVQGIESELKKLHHLELLIYSKTGESAKNLANKISYARAVSDLSLLKDPDVLLLAVKPQQLAVVAPEIKKLLKPKTVVISILAAIPLNLQQDILGTKNIIRLMPNMPIALKKGVSLIWHDADFSSADLEIILKLFANCSLNYKTKSEKEFEELTLLSGSGPGYIYEFLNSINSFYEAKTKGSLELLVATVEGALANIRANPEKSLAQLASEVTSKNGVTIEVIETMKKNSFEKIMHTGLQKGIDRGEVIKSEIINH